MVRSLANGLSDIQSTIAALQAHEATLYAATVELIELQTSRLSGRARAQRDMPLRTACAEIAAALRISDRTVQRRLSDAQTLQMRFTRTHAALAEGRISRAHVMVILEAGVGIEDAEARARFEQAALDVAEVESAGRLRSIVTSIAEQVHPMSLAERHREARKTRAVHLRDMRDGMGELLLVAPAVIVHGIHDRLTQMARTIRDAASELDSDSADAADSEADALRDDRTMDQLRADVLADMALGGAPVASGEGLDNIRGHVQVTVPVLTLAGQSDRGAELAGHGPIDPDTARRLAGGAPGWDRVMTHPVTGAVLAVDRYRPNEDLKRTLRVRDEHCRFPGCRAAVWRCDIDHSHDAARGGTTSEHNLAHLCKGHHMLKHAARWKVRHVGHGSLEWTSPTGLVYIDVPTPVLRTVRFVDDGDPPPF